MPISRAPSRIGRQSVRVRIWSDTTRLVVTVHDTGTGPEGPFAGLLPAPNRSTGGFALWLAHQLCHHVAYHRDNHGFTVCLTIGEIHHIGWPRRRSVMVTRLGAHAWVQVDGHPSTTRHKCSTNGCSRDVCLQKLFVRWAR
ncbi:ATP-binding protein [Saccharothrix carnea]|uniref:ATP-binding protein n=1 Tax=Saccharothrix carnea TaxID=1280637 RepID=UPI000D0E1800